MVLKQVAWFQFLCSLQNTLYAVLSFSLGTEVGFSLVSLHPVVTILVSGAPHLTAIIWFGSIYVLD